MKRHADVPGALSRAINTADRHPWGEVAFGALVVAAIMHLVNLARIRRALR